MARRPSDPRAQALEQNAVSRETAARLDRFVALLLKWQQTTNLIAASTTEEIWTRHVADSLQLIRHAGDAHVWVDLGPGGGFPGLVVSCALAERTGASVHLVESNAKKAAFLREAARATGAPAIIHNERIEKFVSHFVGQADIITARALAPLPELLAYAEPLLTKGAIGLFPKGQDVEAELTEASKYWSIEATLLPSQTDPKGRIVLVWRAERRRDSGSKPAKA